MGKAEGQKSTLQNLKGEAIGGTVDGNKGRKKKPMRFQGETTHGSPLERPCVCRASHRPSWGLGPILQGGILEEQTVRSRTGVGSGAGAGATPSVLHGLEMLFLSRICAVCVCVCTGVGAHACALRPEEEVWVFFSVPFYFPEARSWLDSRAC